MEYYSIFNIRWAEATCWAPGGTHTVPSFPARGRLWIQGPWPALQDVRVTLLPCTSVLLTKTTQCIIITKQFPHQRPGHNFETVFPSPLPFPRPMYLSQQNTMFDFWNNVTWALTVLVSFRYWDFCNRFKKRCWSFSLGGILSLSIS